MAMRWYIIHSRSRRELSVAGRIHAEAVEQGLAHLLDNVLALAGEGQRHNAGYVLIQHRVSRRRDAERDPRSGRGEVSLRGVRQRPERASRVDREG
jgi:transcription antitermination factor NusG